MILSLLIFLAPLTVLLSSVPASLTGPEPLPIPLLMGKTAVALFPFGSGNFRMALAGAGLAALAPLAAFRMLTLLGPRPASGPAPSERKEERDWAAVSLMAISLSVLSPPFVRAGTTGVTSAAALLFPLLALERLLAWTRRSTGISRRWIRGLGMAAAGGLALAIHPNPAVLMPLLFFFFCFPLARILSALYARTPKGTAAAVALALAAELTLFYSRPPRPADVAQGREHRRLAETFARQNIRDRAEEEYLNALALNPADGSASEALGRLLFNYGEGARAAAAFSRAARFEPTSERHLTDHRPNDTSAWWHLCQNLFASNDHGQAYQAEERENAESLYSNTVEPDDNNGSGHP